MVLSDKTLFNFIITFISCVIGSMENYVKGEVKELDEEKSELPDWVVSNILHMRVSHGSKMRNLVKYAYDRMKDPSVRRITWNGSGPTVTKVISCAEITKRRIKELHQLTNIRFKRVEECWDPKVEGLERLKVCRNIPTISILLSKDPIDSSLPGYQGPVMSKTPQKSESRTNNRGPSLKTDQTMD